MLLIRKEEILSFLITQHMRVQERTTRRTRFGIQLSLLMLLECISTPHSDHLCEIIKRILHNYPLPHAHLSGIFTARISNGMQEGNVFTGVCLSTRRSYPKVTPPPPSQCGYPLAKVGTPWQGRYPSPHQGGSPWPRWVPLSR